MNTTYCAIMLSAVCVWVSSASVYGDEDKVKVAININVVGVAGHNQQGILQASKNTELFIVSDDKEKLLGKAIRHDSWERVVDPAIGVTLVQPIIHLNAGEYVLRQNTSITSPFVGETKILIKEGIESTVVTHHVKRVPIRRLTVQVLNKDNGELVSNLPVNVSIITDDDRVIQNDMLYYLQSDTTDVSGKYNVHVVALAEIKTVRLSSDYILNDDSEYDIDIKNIKDGHLYEWKVLPRKHRAHLRLMVASGDQTALLTEDDVKSIQKRHGDEISMDSQWRLYLFKQDTIEHNLQAVDSVFGGTLAEPEKRYYVLRDIKGRDLAGKRVTARSISIFVGSGRFLVIPLRGGGLNLGIEPGHTAEIDLVLDIDKATYKTLQ